MLKGDALGRLNRSRNKVLRFRVDGYCAEKNTVYEFHGNEFHGWPLHEYPHNKSPTDLNMYGFPYGELYAKTMVRMQAIKGEGYRVVYIFEHDYRKVTQNEVLMSDVLQTM